MRRLRFHFIFGLAAILVFGVCSWLVRGESSPLHDYFLWHGEWPNLYSRLHIMPYIVGMLVSGNVHQPSSIAFIAAAAVQWFFAGFLLSFVFTGFRGRHRENAA